MVISRKIISSNSSNSFEYNYIPSHQWDLLFIDFTRSTKSIYLSLSLLEIRKGVSTMPKIIHFVAMTEPIKVSFCEFSEKMLGRKQKNNILSQHNFFYAYTNNFTDTQYPLYDWDCLCFISRYTELILSWLYTKTRWWMNNFRFWKWNILTRKYNL